MSEMTVPVRVPQWDLADRLAKSLREGRVAVGDMAEYLGVNRNTVGRYINGRGTPGRATIIAWALRTGVPAEWLTTGQYTDPDGGGGWAPTGSNREPTD